MHSKKLLIAENLYRELSQSNSQSPARPSTASSTSKNKPGGKALPPRLLICYLCGQQFGTASLDIHQPQCYVKQLLRWERGDPDTRGRRPIPPDEHKAKFGLMDRPLTGANAREMDAFNDQMFEDFNKNALVPCENCGRTFLPDRLQVHLKSCKPGNTARKAPPPPPPSAQNNRSSPSNRASSAGASKRPPPPPLPPPQILHAQNQSNSPSPSASPPKQSFQQQQQQQQQPYESPTFMRNASDATTAGASIISEYQQKSNNNNNVNSASPGSLIGVRPSSRQQQPPKQYEFENNDKDNYGSPNSNGLNNTQNYSSSIQSRLDARRNARNNNANNNNNTTEDTDQNNSPASRFVKAVESRDPPDLQTSAPNNQPRTKSAGASASKSPSPGGKRMTLAERAAADFLRCQFCSRTFAKDRLAKHEDVCLDKYKSSPIQNSTSNSSGNNSNTGPGGKRTTPMKTLGKSSASATTTNMKNGGPISDYNSLASAQFCEECGNKLNGVAKFCSQCGTRV